MHEVAWSQPERLPRPRSSHLGYATLSCRRAGGRRRGEGAGGRLSGPLCVSTCTVSQRAVKSSVDVVVDHPVKYVMSGKLPVPHATRRLRLHSGTHEAVLLFCKSIVILKGSPVLVYLNTHHIIAEIKLKITIQSGVNWFSANEYKILLAYEYT